MTTTRPSVFPVNAVILGGGTMGEGIAAIFAAGGWPVQVVEPHGTEVADRIADCATQRGGAKPAVAVLSSLDAVNWAGVSLVVECVPEDLAIKRAVFADLTRLAPRETLLTSNSSSFPISAIAEGLEMRGRMAGLHFFMPAHLVPLVEVVSGPDTTPETAASLCETMTALAMRPVHVKKDIPGFLANRMQHALMREALSLAERGIASAEDIDAAVQYGFGMRFLGAGPFLQKDIAGLDIHHAAATTIYPDLCNDIVPVPFIAERAVRGDHGMKSGRGFYRWTADTARATRARYEKALVKALAVLGNNREGR